jgi:hypothetical protein
MIIRANKSQCIYIQKSIKQKHGHTSPHDKMKLWKQDLIPSAKSGSFDRGNQTPFIFRIASSNRELAISLSLSSGLVCNAESAPLAVSSHFCNSSLSLAA